MPGGLGIFEAASGRDVKARLSPAHCGVGGDRALSRAQLLVADAARSGLFPRRAELGSAYGALKRCPPRRGQELALRARPRDRNHEPSQPLTGSIPERAPTRGCKTCALPESRRRNCWLPRVDVVSGAVVAVAPAAPGDRDPRVDATLCRLHGGRRARAPGSAGHLLRFVGLQRRWQVDRDQDADDSAAAHLGDGADRGGSTSCVTPARFVAASVTCHS